MAVIRLIAPDENEKTLVGRVLIEAPYTLQERLKEMPGARYVRVRNMWSVPRRWPQMVALGAVAEAVHLSIVPDDGIAAWVSREKAAATRQSRLAELITVPVERRTDYAVAHGLFAHQDVGSVWLAGVAQGEGALLLDETGSGKTRTVLAALERIAERGESAYPLLVICPNTVKASWAGEIAAFHGIPESEVAVIGGTVTQRRRTLMRVAAGEVRFAAINWEALRLHTKIAAFPGQTIRRCPECGGVKGEKAVAESKCQAHRRELNEIEWGTVVADEAHRLKNPKAAVTQAVWGLADSLPPWTRRFALTGTPVADTPEDLWPILRYADPDGFPVKSKWVERYCRQGFDWFGAWRIEGLRPERREEFDRWWRPINRRVLKAQALDLPPVMRGGSLMRLVDMKGDQFRAYEEMREEMVAQVENGEVTAANVLVQTGRLMLLASAYGTPGADGALELVRPSCKADTLADDLLDGDHGGGKEPLVIAMASRRLLRLTQQVLADRLHWGEGDIAVVAGDVSPEDRALGIKEFQAGNRRALLMTFGAGGTGITLTAARTMILLQRSWSAIEMKQAIDRIHRIGSQVHDSIAVVDYITRGTVEYAQATRVQEKESVLEEIVRDKASLLRMLGGH